MTNNQKEWFQYSSAGVMLLSGIVLTFICYFMHDDVTENVLIYVAQALVYSGAIYGVSIYVKGKVGEEVSKLADKLLKSDKGSKNESK